MDCTVKNCFRVRCCVEIAKVAIFCIAVRKCRQTGFECQTPKFVIPRRP